MVKRRKILINGILSVGLATSSVFAMNVVKPAQADRKAELQQQIDALQKSEQEALGQANELKGKAQNIQDELNSIEKERIAIESQIKISQAQHDKLQIEIKETEEKIEANRKALGRTLADMSVDEEITPIERLASSENLSKALDNLEYQSSVKDSLTQKVGEIKQRKKELEQKRDAVKKVLEDQKVSEKQKQDKINEQNSLLEKTKGEEAEYKKYAQEQSAQKAKLQEEQNRIIQQEAQRFLRSGSSVDLGSGGVGSSYPWGSNWGCVVDQTTVWSYKDDPLGYGCGQCVSYTAWRIIKETGYQPLWWGNANMWPASARRHGFSTGATPRAGSVAVMYIGAYGHVAWVESVHGDGTMTISQYNWPTPSNGNRWGEYSQMRVSTNKFHEYIYIK